MTHRLSVSSSRYFGKTFLKLGLLKNPTISDRSDKKLITEIELPLVIAVSEINVIKNAEKVTIEYSPNFLTFFGLW